MESDSNESTQFIEYPEPSEYPELGEPGVNSATSIMKTKKTRFSPAEVVYSETTSESSWSKTSKSKYKTCGIHLGLLICGVFSVVAIFSTILGLILVFQDDVSDIKVESSNDTLVTRMLFENLEHYVELMNISNITESINQSDMLVAPELRTTGDLAETGEFRSEDGNILVKSYHNLDDETGEMLVHQMIKDVDPISLIEIYKNVKHREILYEFDRKFVENGTSKKWDTESGSGISGFEISENFSPELQYSGTFENPTLWNFRLHYVNLNNYKANVIVQEAHNMPIAEFKKDTTQNYIWCFSALSKNRTLEIMPELANFKDPFLTKHLDCNIITSGENGGVEVLTYRWSTIMNKKRKVKVAFFTVETGTVYQQFGEEVFASLIATTKKQRELALELQTSRSTMVTPASAQQTSFQTSTANSQPGNTTSCNWFGWCS